MHQSYRPNKEVLNDSNNGSAKGQRHSVFRRLYKRLFIGGWVLTLLVFSSFFMSPSLYAAGIQPTDVLQNGYGLYSCFAKSSNEAVLAVTNMNAAGSLYDDPNNLDNSMATALRVSQNFTSTMWLLSDFDDAQIMATTFDSRDGTIYVSTSDMYYDVTTIGPRSGVAEVWKIDPSGGTPVRFATLPGNQGTGWLDLDEDHDQLYVSNLDDGLIYIVDTTLGAGQTVTSTGGYDTFAPYAAHALNEDTTNDGILDGLPPLGERIWGVGYNEVEERLYYAIWNRDMATKPTCLS